jgi:hypothetical protein
MNENLRVLLKNAMVCSPWGCPNHGLKIKTARGIKKAENMRIIIPGKRKAFT